MKIPSVLACLALCATPLFFTACMDPYDAYGGGPPALPAHRPGYTVTVLPSGYRTVVVSGTRYYQHGGVYYQRQGRGYVVVGSPYRRFSEHERGRDRDRRPDWNDPHPGQAGGVTVVRRLPGGYRTVTHRGVRYYRAGDVYYQSRGDGYIVVRNPY
jgi:hypothetical protein